MPLKPVQKIIKMDSQKPARKEQDKPHRRTSGNFPKKKDKFGRKRSQSFTGGSGKFCAPYKCRKRPMLPTKFLLGGNICDPLNLNSLQDEEINRTVNAVTPKSSPVPTPPQRRGHIEVIIPPNIHDPLNLIDCSNDADYEQQLTSPFKKGGKRRKKKKRTSSATTEVSDADISSASEAKTPDKSIDSAKIPEIDSNSDESPPAKIAKVIKDLKLELSPQKDKKRKCEGFAKEGVKKIRRLDSMDKIVSPVVPQPGAWLKRPLQFNRGPGTSGRGHNRNVRKEGQDPEKKAPDFKLKNKAYQFGNYNRYYGYRNPHHEVDPRLKCFSVYRHLFFGKDILDIGCNIGHITLSVARDFGAKSIVGLDIDKKLIGIARKNVRHYVNCSDSPRELEPEVHSSRSSRSGSGDRFFPISMPILYGPVDVPGIGGDRRAKGFPHNVTFVQGNYVLEDDTLLSTDQTQFDVILCLSVTKWMHLNWGDAGMKQAFRRMYAQLRPAGKLVLEPQSWGSYKHKKTLTETIYKNYNAIEFFPEKFTQYLLSSEVGFAKSEIMGHPHHFAKGFQRPIQIFSKSDLSPSQSQRSYATPCHTVTSASAPRPVYTACLSSPDRETGDEVRRKMVNTEEDSKKSEEQEVEIRIDDGKMNEGEEKCEGIVAEKMCVEDTVGVDSKMEVGDNEVIDDKDREREKIHEKKFVSGDRDSDEIEKKRLACEENEGIDDKDAKKVQIGEIKYVYEDNDSKEAENKQLKNVENERIDDKDAKRKKIGDTKKVENKVLKNEGFGAEDAGKEKIDAKKELCEVRNAKEVEKKQLKYEENEGIGDKDVKNGRIFEKKICSEEISEGVKKEKLEYRDNEEIHVKDGDNVQIGEKEIRRDENVEKVNNKKIEDRYNEVTGDKNGEREKIGENKTICEDTENKEVVSKHLEYAENERIGDEVDDRIIGEKKTDEAIFRNDVENEGIGEKKIRFSSEMCEIPRKKSGEVEKKKLEDGDNEGIVNKVEGNGLIESRKHLGVVRQAAIDGKKEILDINDKDGADKKLEVENRQNNKIVLVQEEINLENFKIVKIDEQMDVKTEIIDNSRKKKDGIHFVNVEENMDVDEDEIKILIVKRDAQSEETDMYKIENQKEIKPEIVCVTERCEKESEKMQTRKAREIEIDKNAKEKHIIMLENQKLVDTKIDENLDTISHEKQNITKTEMDDSEIINSKHSIEETVSKTDSSIICEGQAQVAIGKENILDNT